MLNTKVPYLNGALAGRMHHPEQASDDVQSAQEVSDVLTCSLNRETKTGSERVLKLLSLAA